MPGFSQFVKEKVGVGHAGETVDSYLVINNILESKGRGITYRRSTNIDDKSDDMATWGSVVRGSPVEEDWLKVGPNSYLPFKIQGCYVLLHQNTKSAHQDSARKGWRGAQVHWRLEVSGCRDSQLAPIFGGTYTQVGDHHDRPAYRKIGGDSAIYFWDSWDQHDGESLAGWWFGRIVGNPHCLALNPTSASAPPRSGWQVPPGHGVDSSITIRSEETKLITVQGHKDPTYNGKYCLQEQTLNGHPWFKKMAPLRILYCFTSADGGEVRWNLDHRDQRQETSRGVLDWSAGGYHAGGFIPFGTRRWQNPSMKLTLSCDVADSELAVLERTARSAETEGPWSLILPWEAWFCKQLDAPVYHNSVSGEWVRELAATGISPNLVKKLNDIVPKYAGSCTMDLTMAPPRKKAGPKETTDPPSMPGEPYVVVGDSEDTVYVAKIHAEPQEDSSVYTGLQVGGAVDLYAWDSSRTWRKVWHTFGRSMAIGVWGFVKFFSPEHKAYFKPKDWWYSAPLPLGLLGTAVWENDRPLVRQLFQERADADARATSGGETVTPLLLAGWRGHGDLCIQLLQAGATPLTKETGLQSLRLRGPVGSLLRALSGGEMALSARDFLEIDEAIQALHSDTRGAADDLLDRIFQDRIAAEKQQQQPRGNGQQEAPGRREPEQEVQEAAELAEQRQRTANEKAPKDKLQKDMETREEEKQREKEEKQEEQTDEERDPHLQLEEREEEQENEES